MQGVRAASGPVLLLGGQAAAGVAGSTFGKKAVQNCVAQHAAVTGIFQRTA